MFKNIKKSKISGFSILEVMIATMIIAMVLVGVISLVLQNIKVQYINRNVLIAAVLAQEGMEIVRNIRDENWLIPGNNWNEDLGEGSSRRFIVDLRGRTSITDTANIDASAAKLNIDGSGFYWHGAGTATVFYRLIDVQPISAAGENYLDVKSTVRWKERNQNDDNVVETYIYDWR